MPIEVGEHLLALLEADIEEEDDSDGFVGEFGAMLEGFDDRCAAVLSIVDDELGVHRYLEDA